MTVCGVALGALVIACGDDDTNTGGVTPGIDSGSDANQPDTSSSSSSSSSSGGADAGDAGADADADAAVAQPAKITLVNGAVDFGPNNPIGAVRICYTASTNGTTVWAQNPPLPSRTATGTPFPGLFIGTGGPVPSSGTKLETLVIKPYLLNAKTLEDRGLGSTLTNDTDKFCEELLKPGGADAGGEFIEGKDVWTLPDIPAGQLKNDKSYFLVLSGCTKDSTATAIRCGADWTAANGNLKASVLEVDRTTAADKIGFQFVNVAPTLESAVKTGTAQPLAVVDPVVVFDGDAGAGTTHLITPPVGLGTISALKSITGFDATKNAVKAHTDLATAQTFALVKTASYGATPPANGDYTVGRNFTILAVGDATKDPTTDGSKALHFIALPNDPIVQ